MKSLIKDPLWVELRRSVSKSFNTMLPKEFQSSFREVSYRLKDGGYHDCAKLYLYWDADIESLYLDVQTCPPDGWRYTQAKRDLDLIEWLKEQYPENCFIDDLDGDGDRFFIVLSELYLYDTGGREFERMIKQP